jgi:hypothetical protein
MVLHQPASCSVQDCEEDAENWIANVGGRQTFYLCSGHTPSTDGFYSVIEDDGTITNHEIAVYACADDCPTCN